MTPRELTEEEVRTQLLEHISHMVNYWLRESRAETTEAKLEGLAFSILSTLDGSSMDLPCFIVAPRPCPEDKEYLKEAGENWYPENHRLDGRIKADLGGSLHEFWHTVRKSQKDGAA